ncbi:hypothetical protein [Nocardia puris]|uniref:hypothetical protein n=1 Tax=Nocardia puris TaxID=208602 RepID=UPI002E223E81
MPEPTKSPSLANEIVIDHDRGEIRIDDAPAPWLIARARIDIEVDYRGVSIVRLPILADNVRVIGLPKGGDRA